MMRGEGELGGCQGMGKHSQKKRSVASNEYLTF